MDVQFFFCTVESQLTNWSQVNLKHKFWVARRIENCCMISGNVFYFFRYIYENYFDTELVFYEHHVYTVRNGQYIHWYT